LTAPELRQAALVHPRWAQWADRDELWRPLSLHRVRTLRLDAAVRLAIPVRPPRRLIASFVRVLTMGAGCSGSTSTGLSTWCCAALAYRARRWVVPRTSGRTGAH
jgi:hypothetical protein